MGEKKKISVHKPYVTTWKKDEVYVMEIINAHQEFISYQGWYVVIYVSKIAEFDFVVPNVMEICPQIYIMLSEKKPCSVYEISNLKCCCSIKNVMTGKKRYQYTISETSDRKMPKNIEFLGKYNLFKSPQDEEKEEGLYTLIGWNDFVEKAVEGYELSC